MIGTGNDHSHEFLNFFIYFNHLIIFKKLQVCNGEIDLISGARAIIKMRCIWLCISLYSLDQIDTQASTGVSQAQKRIIMNLCIDHRRIRQRTAATFFFLFAMRRHMRFTRAFPVPTSREVALEGARITASGSLRLQPCGAAHCLCLTRGRLLAPQGARSDLGCGVQVQVQIQGPDALRLVEYLTPRDLSKIVPGQCVYAPLIDEQAGIINDPIILCLAPDRYWLSISDSDVLLWVKDWRSAQDLTSRSLTRCISALPAGTQIGDFIEPFGEGALSEVRFFRFIETEIAGIPLVIAHGLERPGGFELYLDAPLRESVCGMPLSTPALTLTSGRAAPI
ncbi:MAG: hypothetical protein CM15mP84_05120 [Cellvibrionales bacterium]|nr:MAG: hypothetical protein CM15mP84_05120 [Cellvibrionales bacterium]